jgi:hypothetical protein
MQELQLDYCTVPDAGAAAGLYRRFCGQLADVLYCRQGGPLDYPKVVTGSTATVTSKWDICFNKIYSSQVTISGKYKTEKRS